MNPILAVRNISKGFPGVRALSGVSFDVQPGTCHALLGENGAGKSTLGKIIAGLYTPDEGEIHLEGKPVRFRSPLEAQSAGISIVHQELLFAENLSVADNLSLGDLPTRGLWLDDEKAVERAREWLSLVGSNIDPRTPVGHLSVARQQLVQIAGGIGRGARILVFDEPTSSLARADTALLLELIKDLKKRGVTCIYVSHRLEEIFQVCDAATILRDGQHVATESIANLDREKIVRLMVGRDLAFEPSAVVPPTGEPLLTVKDLTAPGKFREISFEVRPGEILGLGGLVGAGRTEVVEAIFGLNPDVTGQVTVSGKALVLGNVQDAMRDRLGLVPEDRKRHGLITMLPSKDNITLPILEKLSTAGWIRQTEERTLAQGFFDRMRVKAPSLDTPALGLSGGNQQKLVMAKWLAADAQILLIDEPTRGVDVGAKAEIHALIREFAASGRAVVLISSDLPELLALSTRLLIMRDGQLVGERPAGIDEPEAMRLMVGTH
jgi:ABC-type sugar transport system ATPase subunit